MSPRLVPAVVALYLLICLIAFVSVESPRRSETLVGVSVVYLLGLVGAWSFTLMGTREPGPAATKRVPAAPAPKPAVTPPKPTASAVKPAAVPPEPVSPESVPAAPVPEPAAPAVPSPEPEVAVEVGPPPVAVSAYEPGGGLYYVKNVGEGSVAAVFVVGTDTTGTVTTLEVGSLGPGEARVLASQGLARRPHLVVAQRSLPHARHWSPMACRRVGESYYITAAAVADIPNPTEDLTWGEFRTRHLGAAERQLVS